MTDKINILLIEDNLGDAKLVEIYLRESPNLNFELTHVTRLSDGIAAINNNNKDKQFDIVLLDLILPDSTGFETLTRTKEAIPQRVSVVVLTGTDDEVFGMRAVQAGAQDYLVKGQIDTSSLTRSVLHAIQRTIMYQKLEETAQSLKISEVRLLQAQQIARIGNYELDIHNGQMYWSEQVFRILQKTKENTATNLQSYLDTVLTEDLPKVSNAINKAIENQQPFTVEHRILTEDDKIKHIRNQGRIEENPESENLKLIGALQDITAYKNTEEQLVQSEERYRTVFEKSRDAIYVTNAEGKFLDFNPSLLDLVGYTREEFASIEMHELHVSQERLQFLQNKIDKEDSVKDIEVKLQKKDGTIIDAIITGTLWNSLDGRKGYHGIIRDVTDLKRTQELVKAIDIAERSASLKEQFLANMSHEIRTPMNVVIGMTHLLEQTNPTPKQTEYLNALNLSSDSLMKLINNILDFSKIESGKLILEKRPFNLTTLITDLVQAHKFKAREKGIHLFTLLDVSLPDVIISDSTRLEQILKNLVSNAVKYTDEGEVRICTEVLQDTAEEITIKFSVKDTGIGISPEKHDTIFEIFTQASENTTRLYGGTGLGLSIAKRLVELFGGNIQVESELGQGSTFSFEISFIKNLQSEGSRDTSLAPFNPEEYIPKPKVVEVKEEQIPTMNQNSTRTINILLVEDHKLNQIVATDLLKRWNSNLRLDVAENGQEAIKILNDPPVIYDVILMDISMPIMDGYETTKYIRNKMAEPIKSLPIIAMTAHAFNKNVERCYEVGMNEFVSKPINPKIFYSKLNTVLEKVLQESEEEATQQNADQNNNKSAGPQIIDLTYLDSLSGGMVEIKVNMLETLVAGLPDEIADVERDCANQDWEQLKASAHKIKATCGYMGVDEMQELAKIIEHNAWNKEELDQMNERVKKLGTVCRQAMKEVEVEVENLKQLSTS